ncbi:Oidioi.mRNA.OKI2018_I69.chr2.g4013.t1.cds [Oikopleura dioica]|uniref:Oidioi.mRNA.OKI2018_I69.chr2.g4013.t1.cds n=1 Tax=Oikopleura dioica TaxID=34765 RepID=A0ABN7T1H6_OIKDI|nr:Oidioi.mRNA.OKI2018_I69.chr2.g4013.t1.cds [Oikopleura dioica]
MQWETDKGWAACASAEYGGCNNTWSWSGPELDDTCFGHNGELAPGFSWQGNPDMFFRCQINGENVSPGLPTPCATHDCDDNERCVNSDDMTSYSCECRDPVNNPCKSTCAVSSIPDALSPSGEAFLWRCNKVANGKRRCKVRCVGSKEKENYTVACVSKNNKNNWSVFWKTTGSPPSCSFSPKKCTADSILASFSPNGAHTWKCKRNNVGSNCKVKCENGSEAGNFVVRCKNKKNIWTEKCLRHAKTRSCDDSILVGVLLFLRDENDIPILEDFDDAGGFDFLKPLARLSGKHEEKERIFNITAEIQGKMVEGLLVTGRFYFEDAKKTCEDREMALPKKPFRLLNLESMDFGKYNPRCFTRAAFWIDDDNTNYPEYIEERKKKVDNMVDVLKINEKNGPPFCAYISEEPHFSTSFFCEDELFDDLGRAILYHGNLKDLNCPKMKINSSFIREYGVLESDLLDKTWILRKTTYKTEIIFITSIYTGFKKQQFNSSESGFTWCRKLEEQKTDIYQINRFYNECILLTKEKSLVVLGMEGIENMCALVLKTYLKHQPNKLPETTLKEFDDSFHHDRDSSVDFGFMGNFLK